MQKQDCKKNRSGISQNKGFSLMEVMLAVSVLTFGMMAALTLITAGLRESIDSRKQNVAGLLAQEGIELVRNIRDNNDSANSFLGLNNANNCRIDIVSGLSCGGSYGLYYHSDKLQYSHAASTSLSGFSRKIEIGGTGNEKIVTSMVIWAGDSFPNLVNCNIDNKCVYVEASLSKWSGI
jgi:prepilin-type N-terminal cleavage/methylation domain-containing protein